MSEKKKITDFLILKTNEYENIVKNYDENKYNPYGRESYTYFLEYIKELRKQYETNMYTIDAFLQLNKEQRDFAYSSFCMTAYYSDTEFAPFGGYTADKEYAWLCLGLTLDKQLRLYIADVTGIYELLSKYMSEIGTFSLKDCYESLLFVKEHRKDFMSLCFDEQKKKMEDWQEKLVQLIIYNKIFGWEIKNDEFATLLSNNTPSCVSEGLDYWHSFHKEISRWQLSYDEKQYFNRGTTPTKEIAENARNMLEWIETGRFPKMFNKEAEEYRVILSIYNKSRTVAE